MRIIPITFKQAATYVAKYHRHNKPPIGCKFCVGIADDGVLVGVAVCGRPIARALDNGRTLEITRTCTNGTKNANSMLYGACRKIAQAMGYHRIVTYTQADEPGSSLRAAGFIKVVDLPPRGSWEACSGLLHKKNRQPGYASGISRQRWEIIFEGNVP